MKKLAMIIFLIMSLAIAAMAQDKEQRGNYNGYTYDSHIDPYVVKTWDRVKYYGNWPFDIGNCPTAMDSLMIFKDPLPEPCCSPMAVFVCIDTIIAYAYLHEGALLCYGRGGQDNYVEISWPLPDSLKLRQLLVEVK